MRLSLLRVFTLITPVHPCIKIKQDMWITWLKFAAKFSSKWLSFQPESTASEFVGTGITQSSYYPKGVDFIKPANKHAVYADAGRCGYGTVDISKARIEVRYRVVDNIAKSDPAISTAATFVVESGNPEIHPV